MAAEKLRLRRAAAVDARALWKWRNDTATRRASLTTMPVPWPAHQAWLERKLADPKCALWIVEVSGKAVGQVRFDGNEVSVGLSASARGRGLGTLALRSAAAKASARGLRRLTAIVKPDNVGSVLAFVRAGYRFTGLEGKGPRRVYRLELELKKHG